jgi:4-amino-4-deoxy-L-arabinose transferase-like glycosyltransferase
LIVPFLRIVDDPLVAGRLVSVGAGALSTLGMFLMGRDFEDSRFGAWSAFFYVICPFTIWYDRLAITESLLLAVFIFSLYFAVRAAVSGNLFYLAGTGITAGLALLTKGTAAVLFMIVPFACVLDRAVHKGRQKARHLLRWLSAVALSLLLGYGIYSLLRFKISFGILLDTSSNRTLPLSGLIKNPFGLLPTNVEFLLRNLFVMLTPVFFVVCLLGLLSGLLKRWRPSIFICIWLLIVAVTITATSVSKFPRFFLILVPPLLFGAAYAVTRLLALFRKVRKYEGKRGLVVVTALLFFLLLAAVAPVGVNMALIIADPASAWLPEEVRSQYVDGWTAGWGIEEIAGYLEEEGGKREIMVGTDGGLFPGFALDVYIKGNPGIDYFVAPLDQLREWMESDVENRPCYLILNDRYELPPVWPLREIKRFPCGEGRYMFLVEFLPARDR